MTKVVRCKDRRSSRIPRRTGAVRNYHFVSSAALCVGYSWLSHQPPSSTLQSANAPLTRHLTNPIYEQSKLWPLYSNLQVDYWSIFTNNLNVLSIISQFS